MRWLLAPLLALSCLAFARPGAWAGEPEIWFAPLGRPDSDQMLTDDTLWKNAARHVNVLTVVHWWFRDATDQQILSFAAFARDHHMKIEMETEAITRFANQACGGIEGYTAPGDLAAAVAVLQRLNVHIDIISMDEPVWFGHYTNDPLGCDLSIPDLVQRVSTNISVILNQFPDVQIEEIEPVPVITGFPDWRDTLNDFRARLTRATGKPIRDIQLDVDWATPAWIPSMQAMRTFTDEQNLGLGMYFNAVSTVSSDAQWIASAVSHLEYVEGTLRIIPEQVIFSSWVPFPAYNTPETSPTALTWLVDRYFRIRTMLQVQFVGQGAHGTLTTERGRPIANATVNGYVPGVDFSQPLPANVTQGVVPPNAAYGLIGYRLNTECNCSGINDVLVGPIQYQETQGGSSSFSFLFPPVPQVYGDTIVDGEWVGGTLVTRIITSATSQAAPNSSMFSVTPGAQYTFTVPASTIGGEGWYGHAMLLWFDQNHNGLGGITIIPDAGQRLMSTATTAADGTFALSKLPRVGPGSAPVTVGFGGDATHRSVTWSAQ